MLKNVPPLLTPDLLRVIAAMGHGDELCVVDRNYPAHSSGRPVVDLPAASAPEAVRALLELLPLDTFGPPAYRMGIVGREDAVPDVAEEVLDVVRHAEGRPVAWEVLTREEFYARAERACVVVATGEPRPYGCFVLVKGTWPPIAPGQG